MSEPKVKVVMFLASPEEAQKMSLDRAFAIHAIARSWDSYRTGLWLVATQLTIAFILLIAGLPSHTALCAVFLWGFFSIAMRAFIAWLSTRALSASKD
jgi:hypothetical protein